MRHAHSRGSFVRPAHHPGTDRGLILVEALGIALLGMLLLLQGIGRPAGLPGSAEAMAARSFHRERGVDGALTCALARLDIRGEVAPETIRPDAKAGGYLYDTDPCGDASDPAKSTDGASTAADTFAPLSPGLPFESRRAKEGGGEGRACPERSEGGRGGGVEPGETPAPRGARFEANFAGDGPSVEVRRKDSAFGVRLTSTEPGFEGPRAHEGSVAYPHWVGGVNCVYRPNEEGVKEDIVVECPEALCCFSPSNPKSAIQNPKSRGSASEPLSGNTLQWRLDIPSELEARLESDGSIGIYGPDPLLSGDIQIGDEKSRELLEKARRNAPKTQLLYRLPAPVIEDADGRTHRDLARFELSAEHTEDAEGEAAVRSAPVRASAARSAPVRARCVGESTAGGLPAQEEKQGRRQQQQQQQCALTGRTTNALSVNPKPETRDPKLVRIVLAPAIERLAYPISIDPTIVVTTTADFDTGNNEGLVSTAGNALTRDKPTSGRVGAWTATTSFPTARENHTSVAYNGYLYVIGGSSGGNLNSVEYAPINADGTVGAWTATTGFPTARNGHTSAAYNGYLYVIGGVSGVNLNDVQYAPINADGTVGAWTATTAFPTARQAHTSVACNGHLYVIGGYGGAYLNDVQYAPIAANGTVGAWTATSAFPTARGYHTSVAYNGHLYVIGGSGGANLNDIQYAPIAANGTVGAWTATSAFPTARENHTSVAYNGYLYVIGGYGGAYLNDVQYAPINANGTVGAWTATATFPTARRAHTSAAANGRLYVIGGYSGAYQDDVQVAPIEGLGTVGAWTTTTAFTTARHGHTSVAYNGYLYVIGGNGGGNLNDVQYAPLNADGTVGAWAATTTFTTPREGHTSVAYNGHLYVIGGSNGSALNDVQYAPINANGTVGSWTGTTAFTTGRYSHTSVAHNGYLYLMGGYGGGYLSDAQYAPINADGTVGAWTTTTAFTTARAGHASVAYSGYMYVIGGTDGGGYFNDVQYAPINADGTVGAWTTTTAFATARDGHTSVAYNGYLYVIGGRDLSVWYGDVQRAPINANGTVGTWTATAAFTIAREDHTSAVSNGNLYVLGGQTPAYLNDVQVAPINPHGTVGAWAATTAFTTARRSHASVAYNGYVYVIGGIGGGYLNDVQYAPINANGTVGGWTATTPFTTARAAHTSVAYNGYLYVIGGNLTDVQFAPINANGTVGAWTATTALTTARDSHTSVAHNGYIYVMGGWVGGVAVNSVEYATINANGTLGAWTATTALMTARSSHTSVVYSGYLYVIGGDTGSGYLNDVQCAPIDANGTVGAWTPTTALSTVRSGPGSAVHNGYLYVMGGTSSGGQLNDVQVAPISANGTVGTWTTTLPFTTARSTPRPIAYNGYLYVIGGFDGVGNLNDVQFAPLLTPDPVGAWSKLVDLGGDVAVNSILVNGASANKGLVRLQYRLAPAATAVFGAETVVDPVTLGTPVSLATTARYVWTRVTLDDRNSAAINPDATNARDVTDIIVDYNTAPAAPTAAAQNKTTGGAVVATGGWTNESQIDLSATSSDADAPDTFKLQFEVRPVADAFTSPGTVVVDNIVFFESVPSASNTSQALTKTVTGLTNGALYHWQVRALDSSGAASAWVGFAGNTENPPTNPADTDFGVDTTAPTVTSVTSATANGNYGVGASIDVTVNFSESVTLTGGNLQVALDTGDVIAVTPFGPATSASGTYTVGAGDTSADLNATSPLTLSAGTLRDASSNDVLLTIPGGQSIADLKALVVDTTAPTVAVTPDGTTTSASPITFTLSFSEAVSGLLAGEVTVSNGTKGALAGGPTVYTIPVTPSAQGAVTCQVTASAAQDAAGNNNSVSNNASVTYDSIVPTVAVTPDGTSTSASSITFTMTFSEAVSGLLAGEVAITNGTAGALSGGPTVYTIPVTPSGQGAVTCQVTASAAQDAAGNNNTVSNNASVTYDSIAPTVAVTPDGTSTSASSITFTMTFSEAVTGLTAGEITLTNGTAGSLAGGPTVYTIPVTPTGQGAVTCQVIASAAQDAAGNNSTASNTANVTYDSVVPTVAVTPDGTTTNGSPITFTLTFSEAVSGLLVGEITATNGTAGALAGGPTVYTIPVTPTAQGSVTCQVIASATQDASGSGNTASNTASVTYDSIAPTAPGTPSASANPNNGAFTLTWSAATDTGGSGVASYTVERAPDGVTFAVIASGLTVTSLGEIGLAAGSYTYRIQAVDAAGNAGAYSALSATVVTETTPPAAVSDLTVLTGPPGTPTSFTLTLRWTAPGDDGSAGAAASYDLRYLTTGPVTSGNFASATPVSGEPAPSLAGSTEQITVSGLAANTTYFFGLVTVDDVGNTSGLSNATSQGTRVGVPQNLSAIANDGTIDLSWDPVSGAAGYLVSYGQDDGGPYTGTEASEGPSPVNVATTSITLHVPNNKQFYLVVAAYAPTTAETGDASLQIPALAHPASTQSVQTRAISGGTEATSYRMVGFPVLPADTNPIANLSDDFGPYDTRNWRLFGWIASTQEYEEVPATGSGKKMHRLRPGEGFWMISRADVVADVSGSLADMGVPFDIALEPGWNLIGHPFNFAVNWSDCTVNGAPMFSQSLMGVELWDFNGSYFVASQLTNGRGYFVKNLTASSITLSIPPVTASKPTWIDPAAIGVLYASSGPPPGPPAAINAEASGGGTATASSIAPTTVFSGGSGDGGAGSPSGGGGGGGGCFATRLASAAPGTAGLLALAFLAIGLGLRHAMDRSFRGA